MNDHKVGIIRYTEPRKSVSNVVELSGCLDQLPPRARVFIKPNIVFWAKDVVFPKWGVITTSRVMEDMVELLRERGIDDITIGEGTVTSRPKDRATAAHAFETLGYGKLKARYGVNVINVFERPFETVDLGAGVVLNMNADALHSDFLVNLPVLKTHAQTVVSLGIKNLKGLIDVASRKKCHGSDPVKDLHYMVARLANRIPPSCTVIDGIYSNERGPGPDGRAHRTNVLVASADILSADKVGAALLGYAPKDVPHLVHACEDHGRPCDLSDVEVTGVPIEEGASRHEYAFPYTDDGMLPKPMADRGIKGVYYRKYDHTMCTYCSGVNGVMLTAIANAWRGEPWNEVEILTGKLMRPTPGKNKTVLLGKCMYELNKDHPDIKECIAIKGCPPTPKQMVEAMHKAGIEVNPALFDPIDNAPGFFMKRYEGRSEFDESLFRIA